MQRLKNFFITTLLGGLFVLLPIAIFMFIITFLFRFINGFIRPLAEVIASYTQYSEFIVDFLALAAAILFCFVVGLFIRTRFGKNIFTNLETRWLTRLPLYSTIKETVQQFTGAKTMPFSEVVLVRPFSSETAMTGFITEDHGHGNYTVFVPTGPNPTNGFIFHVKEYQLERLSAGTEDAMRSIIGVGVGSGKILYADRKAKNSDKGNNPN